MKKLLVLFAAVALVGFAVPAMAVDWNFYGSARMETMWVSDDYNEAPPADLAATGQSKDSELRWDDNGGMRIGANVKAESIRGRFELGTKGDGAGDVDVGTRLIWGRWNFGPGYLKVGKDYTPVSQFISGQIAEGDLGMLGYGTVYGNRTPQIALGFGGFEIAFMQPHTEQLAGPGTSALQREAQTAAADAVNEAIALGDLSAYVDALAAQTVIDSTLGGLTETTGDIDQILPKIEAKWGMGFDTWNFNIRGGFNTFKIEDVQAIGAEGLPAGTDDITVTSWLLGADGGVNFGPAYIKGAVSYSVNPSNAAWNLPALFDRDDTGDATWDGSDDANDTTQWMGAIVGGIKVSDMLAFEGGFGYRQDDPNDAPSGLDNKTKAWSAYAQSVITLAPGVYIIPEVSYFEAGNNQLDQDMGSRLMVGGKWQIDF
jgi:hypothetical protein